MKKTIIRTGLETLYFSGLHHWMRPLVGGGGPPTGRLEVPPVFFEGLLRRLKRRRLDVISLDEMHRRFIAGDFKRHFVCITFDDGYKDLKRWAWPLLKKYELP